MLSRMKFRVPAIVLGLFLVAPLTACQSNDGVGVLGQPGWGKTETGALVGGAAGAAAGAAIGHQSDNKGKGALVGGAAGAVIGGVIGRELEKRDVEKEHQEQTAPPAY